MKWDCTVRGEDHVSIPITLFSMIATLVLTKKEMLTYEIKHLFTKLIPVTHVQTKFLLLIILTPSHGLSAYIVVLSSNHSWHEFTATNKCQKLNFFFLQISR